MYKSTTDYSEVVLGGVVTVLTEVTANGKLFFVSLLAESYGMEERLNGAG